MFLVDRLGSSSQVDLDQEFLINVDLDTMDQTVVDDIMSNVTIDTGFTIEEEITLLQEDGLLDLSDHSDLPCQLGIEATDVGSLLEQFEEASQTLGNCDSLVPSLNIKGNDVEEVFTDKNGNVEKKELTDAVIKKLKSATKQKPSTVMLPMGVPAKRGRGRAMTRGHPVALPANCTPLRLQRVMQQNQELRDSIPLAEVVKETKTNVKKKDELVEVDENYFELILDHDYTKNVANPIIDNAVDDRVYDDVEEGEIVDELETHDTESFKKSGGKKSGRSYRKRGGSPEIDTDNSQYFDKLPSYFTALSIPRKQFKKTAACVTRRGGLSVHDYFERGNSPVRDTSMYDKLPDYYSSFINSTKYDSLTVDEIPNQDDKYSSGYSSPYPNSLVIDSRPPSRSNSRSRSQSHSVPRSESRHSASQSCSRPSRRDSVRCSSYSSNSRYSTSRSCSRSSCSGSCYSRSSSSCSSSSCSTCDSRSSSYSRSRSRSPTRAWQRERHLRAERSRRRSRSLSVASSFYESSRSYSRRRDSRRRNSRSRKRSSYRSPSRRRSHRRYRSRSRSRSRSRGYRSRSRSWDRDRNGRGRQKKVRSDSLERLQIARQKEREEEKMQQMAERRIVYVGGLPNNYKRNTLRSLFSRFGEIEHVQLHFREHGDNYGFVTFSYTCDAYAAIERGKMVPGLEDFDLCFGGRRQFCDVDYADLDGNKEVEEEYDPKPQRSNAVDFDELLRQARKKLQKS